MNFCSTVICSLFRSRTHRKRPAGRKKTERPTKIGTRQTQNDYKNYGNAPEASRKNAPETTGNTRFFRLRRVSVGAGTTAGRWRRPKERKSKESWRQWTIHYTRESLYANGLHMLRGGHNGWDLSRHSPSFLNYPSFAAICTINNIKVVKYQQISAK